MSDLPIFAFCNADVQANQLRSFFRSLGANVSEASEGEEKDSLVLVELSPILATKMENEMEIEMVLNSIVSLIISVPLESVEAVVTKFCDQLKGPEFTSKAPGAVVRVLSNLFHGFSEAEKRILQYRIYCALLKVIACLYFFFFIASLNWIIGGWSQRIIMANTNQFDDIE